MAVKKTIKKANKKISTTKTIKTKSENTNSKNLIEKLQLKLKKSEDKIIELNEKYKKIIDIQKQKLENKYKKEEEKYKKIVKNLEDNIKKFLIPKQALEKKIKEENYLNFYKQKKILSFVILNISNIFLFNYNVFRFHFLNPANSIIFYYHSSLSISCVIFKKVSSHKLSSSSASIFSLKISST